jgi:sec-independent protein translocase protein TatA
MISYILPLAVPGIWSILLIVVGIVFLFGGKKIPELMKGIGGGIKEFKKASKDDEEANEEKTK